MPAIFPIEERLDDGPDFCPAYRASLRAAEPLIAVIAGIAAAAIAAFTTLRRRLPPAGFALTFYQVNHFAYISILSAQPVEDT
jgi:hypothetical protein